MAIAEHQPDSAQGLSKIAGVGRSKLDRYGEAVIAVLESHRS